MVASGFPRPRPMHVPEMIAKKPWSLLRDVNPSGIDSSNHQKNSMPEGDSARESGMLVVKGDEL